MARRGEANRLGFAVQLALLRHPGLAVASMEEPVAALVAWLAERLEIPASAFADYSNRVQTMSDHARVLAAATGLRPPAGIVTLTFVGRPDSSSGNVVRSRNLLSACLLLPDVESLGSDCTIRTSGQQMAAWVEVAMDECVSGKEGLSLLR